MTSQTENNNFEMKLLDLQKQLGEEKRTHGETILRYLSAQAQAQTAESEAAKARELVAETTLKLDQAREEIKGLRAQAQAKIEDLEARIAQIKVVEQSQIAFEAQAQELQEAHAKIASLEARMAKVRAVFADSEAETYCEPRNQAQELVAAQTEIENLKVQMAHLKIFEQVQALTQELSAAHAKIAELEAAEMKIKDQEAQMAQTVVDTQKEIQSLRAVVRKLQELYTHAQIFEDVVLRDAQTMMRDLEDQVPKPPVQHPLLLSERYALSRQSPNQLFCIVQNDLRSYFEEPVSKYHVLCKFVPKQTVVLELAWPERKLTSWFRVSLMDGQRWSTIGHLGPENKKIVFGQLVWRLMLERVSFRINSDGKKEYQLGICCEALPNDPTTSSF